MWQTHTHSHNVALQEQGRRTKIATQSFGPLQKPGLLFELRTEFGIIGGSTVENDKTGVHNSEY